ncbi:hypothetical protein CXF86_09975 [Shewanella sp. GutCb]|nr:hypothetical protein CXF86_09975 [Shewanella sp. GutCb]
MSYFVWNIVVYPKPTTKLKGLCHRIEHQPHYVSLLGVPLLRYIDLKGNKHFFISEPCIEKSERL